jgi:hypothetical protein
MTQNNQNTELLHNYARKFCDNVFRVFLCEDTQLDNLGFLENILLNNDYLEFHSNESVRKQNCKTFYKKDYLRNESVYIELKLILKIFKS